MSTANSVSGWYRRTRSQSPGRSTSALAGVLIDDDRRPTRSLQRYPVAADLVYGLVNVRTDGEHVLCATLEEVGTEFDVKCSEPE